MLQWVAHGKICPAAQLDYHISLSFVQFNPEITKCTYHVLVFHRKARGKGQSGNGSFQFTKTYYQFPLVSINLTQ